MPLILMKSLKVYNMDACCGIFTPYPDNNPQLPIKPSFQPLLAYHGRILSLCSALPEDGYVLEIIHRIMYAVAAPFMYLVLGIHAIAGSLLYTLPPSLIEDIFEHYKEAFSTQSLRNLAYDHPSIKKIYVNVHAFHQERGTICNKSLGFNTPEWQQLFARAADASQAYQEHMANRLLAGLKMQEQVMAIAIDADIRDSYRKLSHDEFDKVTYSFTAVGQDSEGTFHKSTMIDKRAAKKSTHIEWKTLSFADPAQLDEEMKACFFDTQTFDQK